VIVLCNPASLPAGVPDRSGRPKIQFLFLGRIGHRKGAFDLLQAFATLPIELRERARLVFAGDGEVDDLREQAQPLGTDVEVHSWIDNKRRDDLLNQSDVFVLPSYHEGVPMALLEAMAHGLPVITTPVGGIPDAVTDGVEGLLVQPGEKEQLARALEVMIEQGGMRQVLGRNARARAERCDVKQYSIQLAAIYRRLLASAR
jgi:glycosyltransferase involved in cell wall biosynthesis